MGSKTLKDPTPTAVEAPYGLWDLVCFPLMLTIVTGVESLIVALHTGGPDIYWLAAGFTLGLAIISFSAAMVIGGLGLIPSGIRWLYRRLARRVFRPKPALWDAWMDGP